VMNNRGKTGIPVLLSNVLQLCPELSNVGLTYHSGFAFLCRCWPQSIRRLKMTFWISI